MQLYIFIEQIQKFPMYLYCISLKTTNADIPMTRYLGSNVINIIDIGNREGKKMKPNWKGLILSLKQTNLLEKIDKPFLFIYLKYTLLLQLASKEEEDEGIDTNENESLVGLRRALEATKQFGHNVHGGYFLQCRCRVCHSLVIVFQLALLRYWFLYKWTYEERQGNWK